MPIGMIFSITFLSLDFYVSNSFMLLLYRVLVGLDWHTDTFCNFTFYSIAMFLYNMRQH